MPERLTKKKSLLDATEANVGLLVKYYSVEQGRGRGADERLKSLAGTGRIALKVTQFQQDDQLALCVAMHTYMGLLLKIAGPHFEWGETSQSAVVTELGSRLLLCADLLEQYLSQRIPLGWNDDKVYLQSAYINLFRATFAVSAAQVRTRQNRDFVDGRQLSKEDVAQLQRALKAALRWMSRPYSCTLNRHLYVEMLKTKRSIDKYVRYLESHISGAVTLLVEMNMLEGFVDKQQTTEAVVSSEYSSAQAYMACFKTASSYISRFKTAWRGSLLGHLVKVTRSNQSAPQCVMLFFLKPLLPADDWKTQLHALEVDFNRQRLEKGCAPVRLTINDLALALQKHSGSRAFTVRQLIDDLFIKELHYRRLNLPTHRRSWSKGVPKS